MYFPEPVFRNIASFLVDPAYYKKKHAEVWQTIRVGRLLDTQTVCVENAPLWASDFHRNTISMYVVWSGEFPFPKKACDVETDPGRFKCQHSRKYDNAREREQYWDEDDGDLGAKSTNIIWPD